MSKPVIILVTVGAWLVGCAFTAYHYVVTILALPHTDAYARDWGFQLLMFGIFRFPFWFVGLLAVVSMEIVMLKPSPGKLR
jgi:hypothetical protein